MAFFTNVNMTIINRLPGCAVVGRLSGPLPLVGDMGLTGHRKEIFFYQWAQMIGWKAMFCVWPAAI